VSVQWVNGPASLHFQPFAGTLDDWGEVLATFPDREIFQTPAWIRYLSESQRGLPVILVLKEGNETVGHFAGLVVRKAGLKILGAPFVGWTTERMGLHLLPDVPKRAAVEALVHYAFDHLGCVHLELTDLNITPDDVAGLGVEAVVYQSSMLDLTPDEDRLYANMSAKSCRYSIRKAEKLGVVIEEAHDEGFADDYYAQLRNVFAKQGLVPTYGKQRVQSLIRHLLPTGNLLLLRAREPQGRCIATAIFLGMHNFAYFWGNASWRQAQHFCPNEALHWYAIRYWKQKGLSYYDFCGGGEYKRKYGGQPLESYRLSKSKHCWVRWARGLALRGYRYYQRLAGFRRKKYNPFPIPGG